MGRKKGRKPSNIVGEVFGRLKVLRFYESRNYKSVWECECSCGTICIRTLSAFRKSSNNHCGCVYKENKIEKGINNILLYYKNNAKKRNLLFEIPTTTFKDLILSNCYYCNSPPSNTYIAKRGYAEVTYNGVDRINNDLGYTLENSVSCCKKCNMMKYNKSEVDFIKKVKDIYHFFIKNSH